MVRALHRAGADADALPAREGVALVRRVVAALPGLDAVDRGIVDFVAGLTLRPRGMTAAALAPLREAGLDDHQIHDVVQVACCFSFMNRLADGTGVTLKPGGHHALARELFGDAAVDAHLAWGAGR